MLVFGYVLIMLAAICLSNIVNRFIPIISVPIVQIVLGAIIALLPLSFKFELNPDLFFVLFVAPLVFYASMSADKKTLWAMRKPILKTGILLVLVTVVIMGYAVNFLIPSIPLAAAFALIAALGPTDDVAVASVGKRVNVPSKIMNILQGESIINDASGIVSFQFALAAMLTGSFSLLQASGRFIIVALGGIAVGLVFSWFKYFFVGWIRSLGMENVTLHLLLGLLTPFLVYLIAEEFDVSGILAIFAAGIAHSFNRDKFNPSTINLSIASESVWSMLVFTLEGLVFVILGTQLPQILTSINQSYSITTWEIVAYILLISLLFLIIRFIWSLVTIKKKIYDDPEQPVSSFKAGIIFSLSGARGAVTLASVMSIPILMSDGTIFPERDLIILIAGGVIVVSLIITSFILPLCVEKKADADRSHENETYLEILQNVITELKKNITPENESATILVIGNYHSRSAELQHKQNNRFVDRNEERKWKITVLEWEKENVKNLLESGKVDEYAANYYLDILDNSINQLADKKFGFRKNIIKFLHRTHKIGGKDRAERSELRAKVFALMTTNMQFVLEKLRQMEKADDNPVIPKIMADYEFRMSMPLRHSIIYQGGVQYDEAVITSVVAYGFQIERDNIQFMLEAGRISKESAKEMRHNISLLEVQLKKEYI